MMTRFALSWMAVLALTASSTGAAPATPQTVPPARPGHSGEPPGIWKYQDFLDGKLPPKYEVRKGHPRFLITPENKGEIIEKIKAGPGLWQRAIDAAKGKEWEAMLACAMIYQMDLVPGFKYAMTREQYGRKAVELLLKCDYKEENVKNFANPAAYDWVFDLMTPEQRKIVVQGMIARVKEGAARGGKPYAIQDTNGVDNQAFILGLAFYGDGVDDAAARDITEGAWKKVLWNPEFSTRHILDRSRTVLFFIRMLEGGCNDEGNHYFPYHCKFPLHVGAWKTATGVDCFAHMGYFRNLPYLESFIMQPFDDGTLGHDIGLSGYLCYSPGCHHNYHNIGSTVVAATGHLRQVDPRGAALARWWVQQHKVWGDMHQDNKGALLVYGLLIGDPRVRPLSPRELEIPLTHVMRGLNLVFVREE
jgi:hypothetical protein